MKVNSLYGSIIYRNEMNRGPVIRVPMLHVEKTPNSNCT